MGGVPNTKNAIYPHKGDLGLRPPDPGSVLVVAPQTSPPPVFKVNTSPIRGDPSSVAVGKLRAVA